MNIQVGKWGNSLGVRIPSSLAKELGLHDGSELDLQQISGTLVMRPVVQTEVEFKLEELLAKVTPETLHSETYWGEAVGKEEW
jgi:antitoxin MazE